MPNPNGGLDCTKIIAVFCVMLVGITVIRIPGIMNNTANAVIYLPWEDGSEEGSEDDDKDDTDDDDTSEDPEGGGGGTCNGKCINCEVTDWSSVTSGIQSKVMEAKCNTATCKCTKTIGARCAPNYYGTPNTAMTSGCTACPQSGHSNADSTSITSCYLPAGTTGSDSTGAYTFASNCYYTQ